MTDSTDMISHATPSIALDHPQTPPATSTAGKFWSPETMRFGATFFGRIIRALHRSRRRHARRVIREHQHLLDAARVRPLVTDAAKSQTEGTHLSMRSETSGLLAAAWRGAMAPPRTSEQASS